MPEMQSKKLAGAKKGVPVQQYLDIAEIRDDVVLLKDKSMRAVLAISSINFALKGEDEQNALISGYAQFLNSLEHPVQIVIQSRTLNIDDYLSRLKAAEKQQTNDLLRVQITDYVSFVKELVELGEIMSKRFYVVVPYSPISDKRKSFWSRLSEVLTPLKIAKLKAERFAEYKGTLVQRVSHIQSGLASIGLKTQLLDTQALIELYYRVYNPDLADIQKIQDITKLRAEETYSV
ncbi:hypothetical protein A3B21_04610 [Candidatus Uhrbacteria bacterium RIFCSPLOWO2_01_FULL_47_24]|uniref:TraC-like domain-containing protein n=1 Tax=Candidatus Uhrbacteria bacterium RIFCSPLOWO2_01_FULL_47_24 TaxID=1802401 RepID=A0A1F7UTT4_9BACT|nr:MAG: hypothetical protein A3F52_01415 [Candidatus Uhrbacteria bacterium RIFCSPHIGHO2_12_FULL_47_11]OGL81702.1 MAG: hypothetical protein A3B21_04610 [Candidatus Uhrbacteria bacterium RIFCSPLOWO2_01_FULL_47_24]OGL85045.1 MAG: hypothetical protein A3J03_03710 [Candidatus Uhrbacteria bacterium RIFCSPLOWO2_02_FULL_46_25]OGL93147.1 MAG: hypothetical protein A3H11_00230 [Candidatus Uhrbacteria bacterium RIFCSPLOWO2_12_FULL_47_10]